MTLRVAPWIFQNGYVIRSVSILGDQVYAFILAGRLSFFLVFVGTLEWCQTY